MDEREKSDRGVIYAAILLQLIAAPFILVTVIVVIGLLFVPFLIATANATANMTSFHLMAHRFAIYAMCMVAMVICYIVSNSMMMMAQMMKANHTVSNHRQSPKCRLYELADNLLIIIGLELIFGSVLGVFFIYIHGEMKKQSFEMGEVSLFLFALVTAGIFVFFNRGVLLKKNWWREP